MVRRRWYPGLVLPLVVVAALGLTTGRPADAGVRLDAAAGAGLPLPTITLPLPTLPLPTPSLPLPPLPTPTLLPPVRTPPPGVTPAPARPAPTPTGPAVGPPGSARPGAVPPPGVGAPDGPDGTGMMTPDEAALLIANNPGADLYPQLPLQPASTLEGQLASRLSDVEHRMQYLHNVLTRTNADLAVAQRAVGPVPQLITALAGPAATSPATVPAADTPAGRVAALSAAVASGSTELARRDTESQALQQQIAGWMRSAPAVATGSGYPGGRLLWPVRGPITSGFGNRLDPYYHVWQLHAGIDVGAPAGTPIVAAAAGRVTRAGWSGGYGNYTCIEHGQVDGYPLSTCYGHQSVIDVTPGQEVAAGQVIGLVGATGAATGPHLDFQVRLGGRPVDPVPWLG